MIFHYMLQVILCSAILFGYYHCFLRNELFHRYNRSYLLFSVGLSLLLPLLKIPVPVHENNKMAQVFDRVPVFPASAVTVVLLKTTQGINWELVIYSFAFLLTLALLTRLLCSLRKIKRIKQEGQNEEMGEDHFYCNGALLRTVFVF